jgi:hypothetical protein
MPLEKTARTSAKKSNADVEKGVPSPHREAVM